MKKPPSIGQVNERHVCPSQQQTSSGAIARVRRFFSMSLGHKRHHNPQQRAPNQQPSYPTESHQLLRNLKRQADNIISRPLDDVMNEQETQPHGVPMLVHNLCYHMIKHGTDYEILVSDTWSPREIQSWLRQIELAPNEQHLHLSDEGALGSSIVAGLLRLFLSELPHPLLTKSVAGSIFRIYKDQLTESAVVESDDSRGPQIRSVLRSRLPENNLRLLVYLVSFLNQMQASYLRCRRPLADTSRVLGRVLCDLTSDRYTEDVQYRLAYFLLQDYELIFSEPIVSADEGEYNSDSVSSAGDSRSDNTDADLYTPDDCLSQQLADDSTTTSDTDEFRSLPVSPLKEPAWSQCSRSTKEASEIDRSRKISTVNKDKIRSITDLLSSPDDSSRDEGTRLPFLQNQAPSTQTGVESGASDVDDSDEVESEAARDADGSDTEGGTEDAICAHDERRFTERFYPKNRKGSSSSGGMRSRRRMRRKNSKDLGTRQPSSDDEDRNDHYSSSNTNEDEPSARIKDEGSLAFRDLLASNEPVTSDRASWGLKMYSSDNSHRTAPRYSRFEDESSNIGSFYQDLDTPSCDPYHQRSEAGGHPAIKALMKSISSIKRQIKKFEDDFEFDYGYKPSHSEKMKHRNIKKLMSEMNQLRKELKQLKDDVAGFIMPKSFRSKDIVTTTTPSAALMKQIEESLYQKRHKSHRPQDVPAMETEDLKHEKANLQEALLYYEKSCGRPISHEDKSNAKHLYKRYRAVKQRLNAGDSSPELIPIVENVETVFLETASPLHRGSLQNEDDIKQHEQVLRTLPINPDPHPDEQPVSPDSGRQSLNLADLHSLPAHELRERKKIAKENKKTLKRALRRFEVNFEHKTGHKVGKDDRGPMEKVYMEYKLAKAKLKLLNALLSKDEYRNV